MKPPEIKASDDEFDQYADLPKFEPIKRRREQRQQDEPRKYTRQPQKSRVPNDQELDYQYSSVTSFAELYEPELVRMLDMFQRLNSKGSLIAALNKRLTLEQIEMLKQERKSSREWGLARGVILDRLGHAYLMDEGSPSYKFIPPSDAKQISKYLVESHIADGFFTTARVSLHEGTPLIDELYEFLTDPNTPDAQALVTQTLNSTRNLKDTTVDFHKSIRYGIFPRDRSHQLDFDESLKLVIYTPQDRRALQAIEDVEYRQLPFDTSFLTASTRVILNDLPPLV